MEDSTGPIAENAAAQAEELEALQSIYGSDCTVSQEEHRCQVKVFPLEEDVEFDLYLHLIAYFPDSYPSCSPPIAEIEAPWLQENTIEQLNVGLRKLFDESVGNVVVFRWIEWLKEQVWLWDEARHWMEKKRLQSRIINMDRKETGPSVIGKPHQDLTSEVSEYMVESGSSLLNKNFESSLRLPSDDKSLEELDRILGIVHGAPFTEKKSTFQAHLSSVTSSDQVETVMEALLRNRKIAGATHNIMAYRINIPDKDAVLQYYDDDGESAAGGRLLHLLQIVDATNVMVVVSRWYGGILLGPDRFKHINNAARSLLLNCGYIKVSGSSNISLKKQGKSASQKGKKK